MVDGISGSHNNGISELKSGLINQNQQVEQTNQESSNSQQSGNVLNLFDQAEISSDAKTRFQSEKELMKYSTTAFRQDEAFNTDKVSQFKSMLDSGRINDYLSSLNPNDLANNILNSPAAALLK